jgi:hypothetical protein
MEKSNTYKLTLVYKLLTLKFTKMETEEIKDKYINALKEQIDSYAQLTKVNDEIIAEQKQYIKTLEGLLEESKLLVEESVQIFKDASLTN